MGTTSTSGAVRASVRPVKKSWLLTNVRQSFTGVSVPPYVCQILTGVSVPPYICQILTGVSVPPLCLSNFNRCICPPLLNHWLVFYTLRCYLCQNLKAFAMKAFTQYPQARRRRNHSMVASKVFMKCT